MRSGGNDQAARVAGINVERNLVLTYVWCGACAALGGILLAGRAGSADPANSGLNYELDASRRQPSAGHPIREVSAA